MEVTRLLSIFLCLSLLAGATPAQAESRSDRLARWSEALELDLHADLVQEIQAGLLGEESFLADGDSLALYARALSTTGGRGEAYRVLQEATPTRETAAKVELALARLELEDDLLDSVIRRLAGPDASTPVRLAEERDAWVLLGKARHRKGEVERALPLLRHFVDTWRLHPEAPGAWHVLAREALVARDLQTAARCRDRGQSLATWHAFYKTRRIQIRERPEDPLPRFGLAQLWASVEELEQASEAIKGALLLDTEFARAWALSGEIERKLGNDGAAVRAYDRALQLDATLSDARFNRALMALARGDDASARADLEVIVDSPEASSERYLGAHLALARLLKRQGEAELAEKRHERYKALGGNESL